MIDFDALAEVMGDLDEDAMTQMLEDVMSAGGQDAQKAMDACQKGMDIVGSRFESGEYFVGDLIYAGELMTKAVDILKDALVKDDGYTQEKTKMILCTVKNDLHDIGKNIVRSMLEAAGFDVLDLGIDVPPEKIVETAKNENIRIIGLSGVLTLAIDSMKATVDAFQSAGMRDKVKIVIGGAPVNAAVCAQTGADAWATSPQTTIDYCRTWANE
jgi:dimethylamine corrinoid protein